MSERTGPMRVQTETAELSRHGARGFDAVETWVFDLDNTLYPHHLNLWQQVDVRIRDYIADFLKVTHDEAFRLQKDLLPALWHQPARTDGGARPRSRRISRDRAPDRLFAAHARSRRSARRSRDCPAASSFSPTARARMPKR